jgi:hypothetical protein
MVKKEMNNFVAEVWKKFDLDTDLELVPCHTSSKKPEVNSVFEMAVLDSQNCQDEQSSYL